MDQNVLNALAEGARQLRAECDGYSDALNYVNELAADVNADLGLGREADTDEREELEEAALAAIRKAFGRS